MMTKRDVCVIFTIATIGALLILIVASCGVGLEPKTKAIPENEAWQWTSLGTLPGSGLYRYHDAAKGVTCWVAKSTATDGIGVGISCIPDKDIKE